MTMNMTLCITISSTRCLPSSTMSVMCYAAGCVLLGLVCSFLITYLDRRKQRRDGVGGEEVPDGRRKVGQVGERATTKSYMGVTKHQLLNMEDFKTYL